MKISELARRARVSVPTVKYYLREGLLPTGARTGPNQADYDEDHLRRLHLIRTLRDVGGLDIERIRRVMQAIDDPDASRHDMFGVVEFTRAEATVDRQVTEDDRRARNEVDRFVDDLAWHVRPEAAGRRDLADALAALRRLGRDYGTEVFRPYADAANRMAAWEVRSLSPADPRPVVVERMVVGTVVFGRVFDALRRLAHEHQSALIDTRDSGMGGPRPTTP